MKKVSMKHWIIGTALVLALIVPGKSVLAQTIDHTSFESGTLQGWVPDTKNDSGVVGVFRSEAYQGNYCVKFFGDDRSPNEMYITKTIDLSGKSSAVLTWYWHDEDLESADKGYLDIYDGSWHNGVRTIWNGRDGDHSTTPSDYQEQGNPATLDLSNYNFISEFKIRFRCTAVHEETWDTLLLDEITITMQGPQNQSPVANPGAYPFTGKIPLTVQFTGAGTDADGTIVSYSWDFGDGASSTQQNPSHTYESLGSYTATLTVTDDAGATDSASLAIAVQERTVEIPHLIRFQAELADAQEIPLDGLYNFTFRIYEAEVGDSPIWEEVQQGVVVEEGAVDVELGSVTALELPFERQYWLAVEVDSDGEMYPRFKLTSVPYSFRAEQ